MKTGEVNAEQGITGNIQGISDCPLHVTCQKSSCMADCRKIATASVECRGPGTPQVKS